MRSKKARSRENAGPVKYSPQMLTPDVRKTYSSYRHAPIRSGAMAVSHRAWLSSCTTNLGRCEDGKPSPPQNAWLGGMTNGNAVGVHAAGTPSFGPAENARAVPPSSRSRRSAGKA